MSYDQKAHLQKSYDQLQVRKAAFACMTEEQREAIQGTLSALNDALEYITEIHDLRLSDIDKLTTAYWKLYHSTLTEPTEYQVEGFEEHGIGEYATKAIEEASS